MNTQTIARPLSAGTRYKHIRCVGCVNYTGHKSGYCDRCREITCKRCKLTTSVAIMGQRYCGACEKVVKKESRRL